MAKVVPISLVKERLEGEGWKVLSRPGSSMLFQDTTGTRLPILLHPIRPDLTYLSVLIQRFPALRNELIDAAIDEPLEDSGGFELLIAPGDASDEDIKGLFEALSDLNRAFGGSGLNFEEVEALAHDSAS